MNELMILAGGALIAAPAYIALKQILSPRRVGCMELNIAPPRAYAAIRQALSGFHLGEHHYRIVVSDPTKLQLRAVMEWRERNQREMIFLNPQGYSLNQLILDIQVGLDERSEMTKVTWGWACYDLVAIGRERLIQKMTERLIQEQLLSLADPSLAQ